MTLMLSFVDAKGNRFGCNIDCPSVISIVFIYSPGVDGRGWGRNSPLPPPEHKQRSDMLLSQVTLTHRGHSSMRSRTPPF